MTKIIKGLVCINMDNKDYCEVSDLVPDWQSILSNYMTTHYLRCVSYDVHNSYYIAVDYLRDDDCNHDTLAVLNKANVVVDSIDYIVNCIVIRFKDEESRNLVFEILKGKVA